MTHALNELIYGGSYNINNPEYLGLLGSEIRHTADEVRTKEASPEVVHDLAMAVDVLMATKASPFEKLYPVVEAAAVTEDPRLLEVAEDVIDAVYPTDETVDPQIRELNERSQREFHMAMNRTDRNRALGRAISNAEALNDWRTGDDIDSNLQISDWLMQEQDGIISDKDREKLHELLRRREERKKLDELGVRDDPTYDKDTVRYNPFEDDDEEDEQEQRAA